VRTAGRRGRGQWPRGMPERGRRWSSSQSQCRTRCRRGRRGPRTLRSGCLLLPCLLFDVRGSPAGWLLFQEIVKKMAQVMCGREKPREKRRHPKARERPPKHLSRRSITAAAEQESHGRHATRCTRLRPPLQRCTTPPLNTPQSWGGAAASCCLLLQSASSHLLTCPRMWRGAVQWCSWATQL
jgi:hypothetical protein